MIKQYFLFGILKLSKIENIDFFVVSSQFFKLFRPHYFGEICRNLYFKTGSYYRPFCWHFATYEVRYSSQQVWLFFSFTHSSWNHYFSLVHFIFIRIWKKLVIYEQLFWYNEILYPYHLYKKIAFLQLHGLLETNMWKNWQLYGNYLDFAFCIIRPLNVALFRQRKINTLTKYFCSRTRGENDNSSYKCNLPYVY